MPLTAQDNCSWLETEGLFTVSSCCFSSSSRCIPLKTAIYISLHCKESYTS